MDVDWNSLSSLNTLALKEDDDIQYYSGGSNYNASEEQLKNELLKAYRGEDFMRNFGGLRMREELVLRNAERALLLKDPEINNLVQRRLETGKWFIGSKGFLIE